MDKEQLRKADLLTSLVIVVFGLWIVFEALQMPMTDSYGGVQNVWFVSPALFPLFVGAAIAALGMMLFKIAMTAVGGPAQAWTVIKSLFASIGSGQGISVPNVRFLTIVILFVCYVYLYIPRVDFFLCSLLFLFTFINMFHLEDIETLTKMLRAFLLGVLTTIGFFALGLDEALGGQEIHPADYLTMLFMAAMVLYTRTLLGTDPDKRKRFKHGTIVAFVSPFILGPIFKFFLLVPLPYEGVIVEFLDMLWYWEF